jgi:hypothetical protein
MGDDQDKQTPRKLPRTVVMLDDAWMLEALVEEAKRQARKVGKHEQENDDNVDRRGE